MHPFDFLLGLASTDMGIDLGTANTLVCIPGEGIVLFEPSVVATKPGTNQVLLNGNAVGQTAKAMLESVGYDYKTKRVEVVKNPDGSIKQTKEVTFDNHQSPNPNLILFLMCNLSSQLGLEGIESWKSRQKMEIENKNINLTITGELVGEQITKLAGRLIGEEDKEVKQVESTVIESNE